MSFPILQDGSEQISYRLAGFPVYTSAGYISGFTNMSALCHWHDDVEVLLPCEGYMMCNINGVHVKIATGEMIVINSRQMHYNYSSDGSDCYYICITFKPGLLSGNSEIERLYVQPLIASPGISYQLITPEFSGYAEMFSAVKEIYSLNSNPEPSAEMGIMARLYAFWGNLHTICAKSLNESPSADPDILHQQMMLEFIHRNYCSKLTLAQIAASGNVCRTRCCRIFKKFMQRSPIEYLNSYRLEKGTQLLRSTHLSMPEIAEKCGFNSASYFTELFTRLKGCPPTQYRRI